MTSIFDTVFAANDNATEFSVESRDMKCPVDIAKLPAEILAQSALHGLKQKIADAAASAPTAAFDAAQADVEFSDRDAREKARRAWINDPANADAIAAESLARMEKARDALYAGEWSARAAGGTGLTDDEKATVARFDAWLKLDAGKAAQAASKALKKAAPTKTATPNERARAKLALAEKYAEDIAKMFKALADVV
jgi:hypothetical protein